MPNYAITFHNCQSCVDRDTTNDVTYHQFWSRMRDLLDHCGFKPSGNRSVYVSKESNTDPTSSATQFIAQLQSEYPNMCDYVEYLFLVNLDDDYNLLREPCGCD